MPSRNARCRHCQSPLLTRDGIRVCYRCDAVGLWPQRLRTMRPWKIARHG